MPAAASWTETDPWTNQVDATSDICNRWNTTTATIEATQLSTVQTLILGRLDNATNVGTAALASALSTLAADSPEISVIVVAETGQDPTNDPYNVSRLLCTCWVHGPAATNIAVELVTASQPPFRRLALACFSCFFFFSSS